jgi:hypothetical protein
VDEPRAHGFVERRPGRDDVPAAQPLLAPIDVGDDAARLAHEQRPGRDVVRREVQLPKAVETSGGDVREVDCGRAHPADLARLEEKGLEVAEVVVGEFRAPVREARGEEGLADVSRSARRGAACR